MTLVKEEIIELENKLIEAIRSGNVNMLDKILHDDLLFLLPDGKMITKAIDIASHNAREMVVEKLDPTLENINLIGDTAVVVITYDVIGKMLGNPIQGEFKYIRIWKKFEDGCKVIGGSCYQL